MNKQRLLELAGITEGIQTRTKQAAHHQPGTWRVMILDLYDHVLERAPKDVVANSPMEAILKAHPHFAEEAWLESNGQMFFNNTFIVALEETDVIATLLR